MDCLFFGICKVYVKMPVVLNIAVGSFAVLLKSVLPPKTAKSKMDLAVLLWVKWT